MASLCAVCRHSQRSFDTGKTRRYIELTGTNASQSESLIWEVRRRRVASNGLPTWILLVRNALYAQMSTAKWRKDRYLRATSRDKRTISARGYRSNHFFWIPPLNFRRALRIRCLHAKMARKAASTPIPSTGPSFAANTERLCRTPAPNRIELANLIASRYISRDTASSSDSGGWRP